MLGTALLACGCWWQRDNYTNVMRAQMSRFARDAEYDRLLGPAFELGGEFPVWVRPPLPTSLRALPADLEGVFLGLFQGNQGGGPLIEVVLMGGAAVDTTSEFQQKAFAALATAGKGPGGDLTKQEPATVTCMHGGTSQFEVFSGGAKRTLPGSAAPVDYQWVCYFTEEGTQKLMLAFIIPDADYSNFGNAMVKCLESVALAGKVSAARSGVPIAAPPAAPNP
jgi:hypothetical protein